MGFGSKMNLSKKTEYETKAQTQTHWILKMKTSLEDRIQVLFKKLNPLSNLPHEWRQWSMAGTCVGWRVGMIYLQSGITVLSTTWVLVTENVFLLKCLTSSNFSM